MALTISYFWLLHLKQDADNIEVASGSPLPGVKVIMNNLFALVEPCSVSCLGYDT